ncbi:hypothetical protein CC78DRAFT_541141 [Lojkania enalia]|uniref:Uncharacterized protein n=1 Tax=Lojkania enalia TaxID=147567 RepID=A0A9P4KJ27_9PLEO|nr:hypothetical protein CC78DRAFT_541141 [Didymosphaeria enalia]
MDEVLTQYERAIRQGRHPLIDILNIKPFPNSASTAIIEIPERQEKVAITALSSTEVYETVLSMWSFISKHSKLIPYLKLGKHGWDEEAHRPAWQGDLDLETGVGHQVEPSDMQKLKKGLMSEQEFRRKYPGVGAHQWPCGCQKPWEEYESEEE